MKVIFLDIDGVLYPCRKRISPYMEYDFDRTQLAKQYHCQAIQELSDFDLACVLYGWDKQAVKRLKQLVDVTQAVIVISSSWKFSHSLKQLQALFAFFDLQDAVIDKTSDEDGFLKTPAIRNYLIKYSDVTAYVVLDDLHMESAFAQHAVTCPDIFDETSYKQALRVLQKQCN